MPPDDNPQSWNRYAYVLNSPLEYTDPTGLKVPDPCTANGDGTFTCPPVTSTACNWWAIWCWAGGSGTESTSDAGGSWGPSNDMLPYQQPSVSDSGSGGGGGGGGNPTSNPTSPPPAPNSNPSTNPFLCGSQAASDISLAAGLQHIPGLGSGAGEFITDAVGGNAFSGATDLIHSFATGESGGHNVFYAMGQSIVAGPTQGFGAAFGRSIDGTLWDSDILTVATKALVGTEYASGIGEAKLGYDFLTYVGAVAGCAAGIIH